MEEPRPPDTRDMLRAVYDHPDFVRVWEDSEGVDRYLFVSDDDSYSAHGLVAAHEWTVNHPFVYAFPNSPMISRLRRSEEARTGPTVQPGWLAPKKEQKARVELIRKFYPLPWEGSDD